MNASIRLYPTKECVKAMREAFPKDATVELIYMNDLFSTLPCGLKGQVVRVDDIGNIHMHWENGSSLSVAWNDDIVKNVNTGVSSDAFWGDSRPATTV